MFDFMNITKALSDESRVRILTVLGQYELCVCQITALLDLSPSTVSKHLSILRQARLIESTKRGKWVYYKQVLCTAGGDDLPCAALNWVRQSLQESAAIQADAQQAAEIVSQETLLCAEGKNHSLDGYHSPAIHRFDKEI